jgi:hypothetical protein
MLCFLPLRPDAGQARRVARICDELAIPNDDREAGQYLTMVGLVV